MSTNPEFDEAIGRMHGYFTSLLNCALRDIYPRKGIMKVPGVYALFENGTAVYVGRAKNIWQRIGNHVGGRSEQSSFAFKLAREATNLKASYKPEGSRAELMKNPDFQNAFLHGVERVRKLRGRFVRIDKNIDQHLFEVYAALKLGAKYNDFGTS